MVWHVMIEGDAVEVDIAHRHLRCEPGMVGLGPLILITSSQQQQGAADARCGNE